MFDEYVLPVGHQQKKSWFKFYLLLRKFCIFTGVFKLVSSRPFYRSIAEESPGNAGHHAS